MYVGHFTFTSDYGENVNIVNMDVMITNKENSSVVKCSTFNLL